MTMPEHNPFVIPGRVQRVRAKRGPMTSSDANPESPLQNRSRDSGSGALRVPE
jgi:hypothetical protein